MTSAGPEGRPRVSGSKAEVRTRLRASRAARPPDPAGDERRARRALDVVGDAAVVAAYASVPGEPDTAGLLEHLRRSGVRVLLPVLRRSPDWAWYAGPGEVARGPFGISAPTGPALGADALSLARVILLPGLAGTPDGRRLGTGGGWYDRALAWASGEATFALLLHDEEVLAELPTDPWDRRVHQLVTDRRLLVTGAE